jgi:hypothetical protein
MLLALKDVYNPGDQSLLAVRFTRATREILCARRSKLPDRAPNDGTKSILLVSY